MMEDQFGQTGGELDFEKLYREIAPKLVNYLVANGMGQSSAWDVAQETFLRLWKRKDSLVNDMSQISGLAYTIARNLRTDGWRKAQRESLQGEITDEDAGSVEPAPMPSDAAHLRARIAEAFAQLPLPLREAYQMFQLMELPIREIASRTGTTEANVKVRIFRAKAKLRILLKDLV